MIKITYKNMLKNKKVEGDCGRWRVKIKVSL
jgi:hypothetical protein